MKIQTNELGDEIVLEVQGRLAGAFVPELERCWETARAGRENRRVVVDLKNVTCVDRAGKYLLRLMHSAGVPFRRAGLSTQDILEEFLEEPECKH